MAPILLWRLTAEMTDVQPDELTGTILVVDDDEGVRKLLTRWTGALGHAVKVAPDAETALDVMRESEVDVVLCDIRMPGHDGIWLLDQVGRLHPSVAVVLATGLTEMDPAFTLRPGVVGYIVKPFKREDLEQVIGRGLVERRRLQAERGSGPRALPPGTFEGIVL